MLVFLQMNIFSNQQQNKENNNLKFYHKTEQIYRFICYLFYAYKKPKNLIASN
jgi:hypothetical protein